MARSNGPFGLPASPPRRRPGDDPFGTAAAQAAAQWPTQAPQPQGYQGYGDHPPPPQSTQGYHFPPPEPVGNYGGGGYTNPQFLNSPQWGQQSAPQAYDLNHQGYGSTDPVPFQQHQGGGYEPDADYGDEFMDDEEPRRGLRWLLIAGALVGAIGVGGALAYTYKSLIASHSGRVPLVKADPNVKVKPEQRGGFVGADRKRPTEEAAPAGNEPGGQDETLAEATGPRSVKTIPITGGGAASPPASPPSIPGITLYQPPQPQGAAPAAPPAQAPIQAPAKMQAPPGRVALGGRPPTAAEPDDDEPATPPVTRALPPLISPPVASAPRSPAKVAPSGGIGFVAVLSSQKTHLRALEIFADLQQKYGEVLGSKTPDVQEADLSARGLGTMYRLVVGPPGSHNAASGVCAQLKTAGYEGCWVKEY